jgi:RNA polymerase sigma-70 factor (ECF subfamily)
MAERKADVSGLSDQEVAGWIEAIAQRQDRAAFTRLFETYAPRLKAFMSQRGCGSASAEEIVQDVMISIWRRAGQYDSAKGRPATWIYTIARNRRIDLLRRQEMPTFDPDDIAFVPSDDDPADDEVYRSQYTKKLHDAIAELPEEQAVLLRMAFFNELSHSEIAARAELPIGTVKSRIRLAMQKLRGRLEEELS